MFKLSHQILLGKSFSKKPGMYFGILCTVKTAWLLPSLSSPLRVSILVHGSFSLASSSLFVVIISSMISRIQSCCIYIHAPVSSSVFLPSVLVFLSFIFLSLLGMARRNLRAAGEFCSYPSALKPSACLEGKERGRDRKQQRGRE